MKTSAYEMLERIITNSPQCDCGHPRCEANRDQAQAVARDVVSQAGGTWDGWTPEAIDGAAMAISIMVALEMAGFDRSYFSPYLVARGHEITNSNPHGGTQ